MKNNSEIIEKKEQDKLGRFSCNQQALPSLVKNLRNGRKGDKPIVYLRIGESVNLYKTKIQPRVREDVTIIMETKLDCEEWTTAELEQI